MAGNQLWYGSCLTASLSAAIIIGVVWLCTQEQKQLHTYSQWFVPSIWEHLHIYWWQLTCWARKVLILMNHADTLHLFQSCFHQNRDWVVGGRMECPDEIGKFTNPSHQKVNPSRLSKLMASLLPWLKKMLQTTFRYWFTLSLNKVVFPFTFRMEKVVHTYSVPSTHPLTQLLTDVWIGHEVRCKMLVL